MSFNECQNLKYHNSGNLNVLALLNAEDQKILDIGCGSGDLGRLVKSKYRNVHYSGISCSEVEGQEASKVLDQFYCKNLEKDNPKSFLEDAHFDCLIFSHVLEHLIAPDQVLEKFIPFLKDQGKLIIALPNIMFWKTRIKFISGSFEYEDYGPMDRTYLRFFSYYSAKKYLIDNQSLLNLEKHESKGSFPLPIIRNIMNRFNLGRYICNQIDHTAITFLPNLFGNEIIIVARKTAT